MKRNEVNRTNEAEVANMNEIRVIQMGAEKFVQTRVGARAHGWINAAGQIVQIG